MATPAYMFSQLLFKLIQQLQKLAIFRDIGHRMAIVNKASHASTIHNHLGRHASQFEQVDFLSIQFKYTGFWIRKSNKRQVMLAPIVFKCFCIFRTNYDHYSLPFFKLYIVLAQLRHMPLAERSGKATIKYQQHIGFPVKV
jgi:hypothetical protein